MDKRARFLSQELRHALMFMVDFARLSVHGHPNVLMFTPVCHGCGKTFHDIYKQSHNSYMFMVIKSWLDNNNNNNIKFSCLACKRAPVEDVIELYPSFSLANLKKLLYNGTLKKFVFSFRSPSKKRCCRVGVELTELARVLEDVVASKGANEEIESVSLCEASSGAVVARDCVYHLRVDWGSELTFSEPSQFTRDLLNKSGGGEYYLEVISRDYEEFQPFYVYFHHGSVASCNACANKVVVKNKKTYPVLFCGKCGFTDPSYWTGDVYPFWLDRYDYKRTYWKCHKKINLMLYDVDVTL
ncbi:me53 [Spodoptera frugiperda granulovirus]|uniref:Me53 n=1 Tax=Spodoptera frugiperda granulovirus TaxID=307454 RepID=A0A0C5AQC1_9BBAC|nr:me53 [Spodoptera frugiperda granulovirus]AJK91806.1 me53 [Spodoptera frugiperda granulovirus]